MNHFVYILQCADGSLYTGYTTDVIRRVKEHNGEVGSIGRTVGARYTCARRPVILMYQEVFVTKSLALKRECAIKKMSRAEKLLLIAKEKNFE
jgi:putative endonuclease